MTPFSHLRALGLTVALGALIATGGSLGSAVPALADDLMPHEMFNTWSVVPDQGLDSERGRNVEDSDTTSLGSGAAINIAEQTVTNIFEVGGNVTSGEITMGSHTFANQNMSINAFNTGNNVTMMNQLSIQLTLSPAN